GGLSGPAIKPVAIRMVYQVAKAVKIPVIGIGGISTWEDAVEFFLAGASAVQVGTANFYNPKAVEEIVSGLEEYLKEMGYSHISELVGDLKD
ncbi:MAG: dihydroorotate dehydrogenase, partial [Desulfurobacterium sp.]